MLPIIERDISITVRKGNVPFPYANCRKRESIGTFGLWDITACAFPPLPSDWRFVSRERYADDVRHT